MHDAHTDDLVAPNVFLITHSQSMKQHSPLPGVAFCLAMTATIIMLPSCHRQHIPKDIIQPDTMVQFLTEAYLLEGFYAIEAHYNYKIVSPQLQTSYDSLLAKYHVTDSLFDASLDYYVHHPELYDTIHARAIRQIESQEQ